MWSRKFPVVDGIDIQGYVDLERRKLGFLLHVAGWPQPLRLRRGQLSAAADRLQTGDAALSWRTTEVVGHCPGCGALKRIVDPTPAQEAAVVKRFRGHAIRCQERTTVGRTQVDGDVERTQGREQFPPGPGEGQDSLLL